MPTYEYACSECGNAWEEIQKITAPAVELCPACGKSSAKRQISGGSFILKGGGWYSDLYSSSKPAAKDDSASKSGEASGGDKGDKGGKSEKSGKGDKSDAKTETKSDGASKASEPKKDSGSSSGSSSSGSSGSSGSTKAAE